MVKQALYACEELLKRYGTLEKIEVPEDVKEDSFHVLMSADADRYQKRAARILLNYCLGKRAVNDFIEGVAVITDRNDVLVKRWRQSVLSRDGKCMKCFSEKNLQAHHISHWSDDPVNRLNVENGLTLCIDCHALEHPEIANLILSAGEVV